ncbi:hypothetical protein PF006_g28100, partial [Phytophthora fragariae]
PYNKPTCRQRIMLARDGGARRAPTDLCMMVIGLSQSVSEPPLPKNESVAFKDAWAVLYRAGWTSKRANGRSLDLRYRYVRPGGDPNGKEGDDFLLGEQAVTNYYRRILMDQTRMQIGMLGDLL